MCSIPPHSSGAGRDPYTCMCVKEEEEEGGGERRGGSGERFLIVLLSLRSQRMAGSEIPLLF